MDPNSPNLDVWQMQEELSAQSVGYSPYAGGGGYYGNEQAALTQNRASFGNAAAMMGTGMNYATAAGAGLYHGAGTALSAIGSMIRPASYTPPARISTGYYGQYQQTPGILSGLAGMAGINVAPRGVNSYQYGYYNAANFGDKVGSYGFAAASLGAGLAAGVASAPIGSALGTAVGAVFGGVPGAAVGSAVGTVAGNIAGYMGMDALSESIVQRRAMNSFLENSSFRYISAGSPLSDPRVGGMSASARREVTNFARDTSFKDTSMGMEDLSNILQGATNLGMFSGIRDMDTFKTKFKDIVEGVKSVTKTLGTTLQEGLQVMKDLRSINIDPSQMSNVMMQASSIGKASGRTASEIVGIGLQGAELFRGTGIETKIGYQSNVMNMAAVRSARDAGLLSQEAIVQAGGEEALSQRMTATGLGFMQSSAGRGFGAAFFNPAMGPAGFDKASFMQNMMAGGGSMKDLAMRAAGALGKPQNVIQYEAYQDKFMSEMGKAFGGDTTIMQGSYAMANAAMLVSSGATKDKDAAFRLSLLQMMSPAEADTFIARTKNAQGEFSDKMKAVNNAQMQRTMDEALSTRSIHHVYEQAKREVYKAVEPAATYIEDKLDQVREGAISTWERGWSGIERADVSNIDYKKLAAYGNVTNRDRSMNLDKAWNIPLLGKSTGGIVLEDLKAFAKYDPALLSTIKDTNVRGKNDVILREGSILPGKQFTTIPAESMDRLVDLAGKTQISEAEAMKMRQNKKTATPQGHVIDYLASGKLTESADLDQVSNALFNKKFKDLTSGEMGELVAQGSEAASVHAPFLQNTMNEARQRGNRLTTATGGAVQVEEMQRASADIVEVGRTLLPKALGNIDDTVKGRAVVEKATSAIALARQQKAGSPEQLKLLREAYGAIKGVNPDITFKEIQDEITQSGSLRLNQRQGLFQRAYDAGARLNTIQAEAGTVNLNLMLDSDIKEGLISGKEIDMARAAVSRFEKGGATIFAGGEKGFTGEERGALEKTSIGATILRTEKIQQAIEKADVKAKQDKVTDPTLRIGYLNSQFKEMGVSLDKNVKEALGERFSSSADNATKSVAGLVSQQYTWDKAASGPAGGIANAESMGTAQGSAQEAAIVQLKQNQAVLQAMTAIADKLAR